MKTKTIPKTSSSKKLADGLQYQPDAIVSNEIIRKRKKIRHTATCSAFDKGQGLSEHTAPYDAMVVIL